MPPAATKNIFHICQDFVPWNVCGASKSKTWQTDRQTDYWQSDPNLAPQSKSKQWQMDRQTDGQTKWSLYVVLCFACAAKKGKHDRWTDRQMDGQSDSYDALCFASAAKTESISSIINLKFVIRLQYPLTHDNLSGNFHVFHAFIFFAKNYPHTKIKPIHLCKGNRRSMVKITLTWNVLPKFSRNFPPVKITTFTVLHLEVTPAFAWYYRDKFITCFL